MGFRKLQSSRMTDRWPHPISQQQRNCPRTTGELEYKKGTKIMAFSTDSRNIEI